MLQNTQITPVASFVRLLHQKLRVAALTNQCCGLDALAEAHRVAQKTTSSITTLLHPCIVLSPTPPV
jgi:hypothetical protein